MTWKTEQQSSDLPNIDNYHSQIEISKSELAKFHIDIEEAKKYKDDLIKGNHEILTSAMQTINKEHDSVNSKRIEAEELLVSVKEKESILNGLSERFNIEVEKFESDRAVFYKEYQEEVESLDNRETALFEREEALSVREESVLQGEHKLLENSNEHFERLNKFNDAKLELEEKNNDHSASVVEFELAEQRLQQQREGILNIVKEQRANILRMEEIQKDINTRVNEQANILDENINKEQSIRDLIIEERRAKIELDKILEVQRKASNIMQQQKQELEDLKNQIINHKDAPLEVKSEEVV